MTMTLARWARFHTVNNVVSQTLPGNIRRGR
jgi:hypothetical protein